MFLADSEMQFNQQTRASRQMSALRGAELFHGTVGVFNVRDGVQGVWVGPLGQASRRWALLSRKLAVPERLQAAGQGAIDVTRGAPLRRDIFLFAVRLGEQTLLFVLIHRQ